MDTETHVGAHGEFSGESHVKTDAEMSGASTHQAMPRTVGGPQKLGERHGTESIPELLEETNPPDTLILDL